jgi:MFS family permease
MRAKLIYAIAIFASAFLLFQVEPVLGKLILPWFGGASGVWVVCLLFFQAVLLLGYLYAHLLTRTFHGRVQGRIHAGLLALSLLVLPVLPRASWRSLTPNYPAFHILWLLAITVGLPYFLLSSTSPLLQAWYARKTPGAAPYRFYAVSNTGSMLALLSYPILVEPFAGTLRQARGWSWAYVAFVVLCAGLALASPPQAVAPVRTADAQPAPNWTVQVLWVGLAACGSALLLGITRHISQNIAAVPLLWIVPLTVYLLTFILCFDGRVMYRRDLFLRLLGVALGSMAYALAPSFSGMPPLVAVPLFCGCLFVCCMFCHGELARLKPHPAHLTSFYLMISLGGAIGAVFVALVAPQVFSGNYELRIALGGCALLVLLVNYIDPESPFYHARLAPAWLLTVALAAVIVGSLVVTAREEAKGARLMVRNFYGVLRVVDQVGPDVVMIKDGASRSLGGDLRFAKLMNGTIDHGLQFLAPARRDDPTTYYAPESGVGVALRAAGAEKSALRVGVIGLGVGTLAAYGRRGDRYTFYEINPLVDRLAKHDFTFLRDSPATVDTVLGDGRLSLESESPQGFDLLAVDAFSGDSIPVHLLTREAFALYFRQLEPQGVLAVHISNQYLNLAPVVTAAAVRMGKQAVEVDNRADSPRGVYRASWILVGSPQGFLGKAAIQKAGRTLGPASPQIDWTDDYSSLLQALM